MEEYAIMKNSLFIENRERASLTGVTSVKSFDENEIVLETNQGDLYMRGSCLHVENLNLETGDVSIKGRVDLIEYRGRQKEGSFWSKLF